MPNTLVVSTFGCPFSEFEMMVRKVDKEQGYVFCSELEIIKVNEHKAMILMNCSDLEKVWCNARTTRIKTMGY